MAQTDRLSLPFETGQIDIPEQGAIYVVNAQLCPTYDLFPKERFEYTQVFAGYAQAMAQAGYANELAQPMPARLAIVHLTRARDENRANIAKAYDKLAEGGILVVDGAKTDGIESLLKAIRKILPVEPAISKAHGKVFWLHKAQTPEVFTQWITAAAPRRNADGYWTSAGVFSADKIDKGSQELVPLLRGKLKGHGADLGAGWGYLAAQALADNPEITSLELLEANSDALAVAKMNVTDPRALFEWCDVTTRERRAALDFIITNPPFHQSRKADPNLGKRFIEVAAQMLKPGGVLYLVANRQLAYETTLDDSFRHVERLSQTGQYKCFFARKPKS